MPLPKNTLVRYLYTYSKDSRGFLRENWEGELLMEKKGVLLATPMGDGSYAIGFSFCHPLDKFKKSMGLKIAFGRALSGTAVAPPANLKTLFEAELALFLKRCESYYKGKTMVME